MPVIEVAAAGVPFKSRVPVLCTLKVVSVEEIVPLLVKVPLFALKVNALFVATVTLLAILVVELVAVTVVGALKLIVEVFVPATLVNATS